MIQTASDISDFRKNLRLIVESHGRGSISAIARNADGMSNAFIHEILSGRKIPSIETVYRIAAALKIRPALMLIEHKKFEEMLGSGGGVNGVSGAIESVIDEAIGNSSGRSVKVSGSADVTPEERRAILRFWGRVAVAPSQKKAAARSQKKAAARK